MRFSQLNTNRLVLLLFPRVPRIKVKYEYNIAYNLLSILIIEIYIVTMHTNKNNMAE